MSNDGVEVQLTKQLVQSKLLEAGANPAAMSWVIMISLAVISWQVSLPVNSVPAAVTTLTVLVMS